MYFNIGLKIENYIYLIEEVSRNLISIHIPSGNTKIEAKLPWKYTEMKMSMMSWERNIYIFSPVMNHFLAYDRLEQQLKIIELKGIQADEVGFYYSNVLIDQGDFVVLPFKGKTIKKYGINGELKYNDDKWCFLIDDECNCSESLFGNIRMDSACLVGGQLFFSLFYRDQNYLCKYELKKDEGLCSIFFYSKNVIIRGVYACSNTLLFRRLFDNKTEIVIVDLNSGQQKIAKLDYLSAFEADVYGDIHSLKVPLKNTIIQLEKSDFSFCRKIYNLKKSDIYIANGILFNDESNEVLLINSDDTERYSIKKVVNEIKNSAFYQKEYRKIFGGKYIAEGKYGFRDLVKYVIEQSLMTTGESDYISQGELIWKKLCCGVRG